MHLKTLAEAIEDVIAQSNKTDQRHSTPSKKKPGSNLQETKNNSGQRTKSLSIRFSPEELNEIQKKAGGIKLSIYIRDLLLKKIGSSHSFTKIPAINRQTYIELSRIGKNINQQTKLLQIAITNASNFSQSEETLSDYSNQVGELKALIKVVRAELLGIHSQHQEDQA